VVAAALVLLGLGLAGGGFFGRKRESIAPPTFQQLTFNRGILHAARFDPEDKNVIYSASWDGQAQQLYSTRPDSPESRALDLKNSQLLAVSPSSELAISLGCKYLFATECEGTLARVPVSGGAPRKVLDDVNSADWATDGSGLAVTRQVAGKFRVEFPVGKVVYENAGGWLRSVRISPRGDDIAFMECPVRGGDAGSVVVLDKSGNLKTRTEFFPSLQGLAWSPTGDEVWFGATRDQNEANEVHGVTLSGKDRIVLRAPGIIRLHDVSRDGRILISRENWRGTMLFRGARDMKERDLSWLDYSYAADISRDGENLVFFEWGAAAGSDALAYERKRDGSPPIKLGAGAFPALSPDGKWVVAITPPSVTDRIFLLPTGSGEARNFDPYTIKRYASPGWMPDGRQIIFSGNDGREWRIYTQDLTGGRPRPVTPPVVTDAERFDGNLVSGDGKYVFARDLEGKPWRYPVGGGDPQPVPGIERDDSWIGWSSDNRFAYIFHWGEAPTSVFRLDLTTGRKQSVAELAPGDLTGVSVILTARITPDGKSYAYTLERVFSELYLVSGVK
jgi:Tol biopolymer transport system component